MRTNGVKRIGTTFLFKRLVISGPACSHCRGISKVGAILLMRTSQRRRNLVSSSCWEVQGMNQEEQNRRVNTFLWVLFFSENFQGLSALQGLSESQLGSWISFMNYNLQKKTHWVVSTCPFFPWLDDLAAKKSNTRFTHVVFSYSKDFLYLSSFLIISPLHE